MTRVRALPRRHAVYRLTPALLLVFKPRGHRETAHAHAHGQRLRVLSGRLEVRIGRRTIRLDPRSHAFVVGADRPHATIALDDTWLLAESV